MRIWDLQKTSQSNLFFYFTFCCFIFLNIFSFISFWLHWVCAAVCRLSLAVESRGSSFPVVCGFHIVVASLVVEQKPLVHISSCGAWAQQLLVLGLSSWGTQPQLALHHGGSSQTWDWTGFPCTAHSFLTTASPGKPSAVLKITN